MKKLVIFDWGRTLYDPDTKDVFPGVPGILKHIRSKYELAIVCLATDGDINRRIKVMEANGIKDLFSKILIAKEGKDKLFEQALSELGYSPEHTVIVDDRTIRGIQWGNQQGATTIWMKQGKFSEELPNTETGQPDYIISNIREILAILP